MTIPISHTNWWPDVGEKRLRTAVAAHGTNVTDNCTSQADLFSSPQRA